MLSSEYISEQLNLLEKYLVAKNLAAASIRVYKGVLSKYLSQIGEYPYKVASDRITAYIATNYSNGCTMGQLRGALQHYYEGVLHQKKKIDRVPYPKKETKIPQVLKPKVSIQIIAAGNNTKHQAIMGCLYWAALRRNEVCGLKFKHITADLLFISQAKGAKDRKVPLSIPLKNLLKAYFSENFPLGKCNPNAYVFEGQNRGQYTGRSVEAIVTQAGIKCQINQRVYPHLMRHNRATDWLNAGMDISEISKLLGHKDIKTTMVYLHTATDTIEEKIKTIDELIQLKAA